MDRVLCEEQIKFKPSRVIIIIKSYGFYFFNMFMPKIILVNYPNLYWWGITKENNKECYALNPEFFKGVLALIISLSGLIFFQGQDRIIMLCMILSIAQWSAILSAVQVNADRYMAFAVVFMMYFLAKIIMFFPMPTTILLCIMVYYITKLYECMKMYETIDWYQRYQMFHVPSIAKPRFNRIDWYFRQKRFLTAWYLIEEGLQHMPNDFLLLYQAAIALSQIGNLPKSLEFLDKASKNCYLGQEKNQMQLINDMRDGINSYIDKNIKGKTNERKKRKNVKRANSR